MKLTEEDVMDLNSGLKALEDKHFARAVQLLSPLAEKGEPEAQHRMAVMYQNGLGVHRNETAAALWMKLSAEQGYELAWHGMGFMYMEGEGVEVVDLVGLREARPVVIGRRRLVAHNGASGFRTATGMALDTTMPVIGS